LLLGVLPLVLVLTSFTRITIVLGFVRQGLGLGPVLPGVVVLAVSLALTAITMQPLAQRLYDAYTGAQTGDGVDVSKLAAAAADPLRQHMLESARTADVALVAGLAGLPRPESPSDLPLLVLACGYLLSELRAAFQIGIIVLLPFLLVDILVAAVASSLALPGFPVGALALMLKLYLFVAVDGWALLTGALVRSFR
jgi:flagellar biosynthetic protein FliP